MTQLASMTTGRAMLLLDMTGMALFWPVAILVWTGSGVPSLPAALAAAVLYPTLNLVALYALGLYRRDVVIEVRRSIGRIPLVTFLGAAGTAIALALGGVSLAGNAGPIPLPVVAGAGVVAGATAVLPPLRARLVMSTDADAFAAGAVSSAASGGGMRLMTKACCPMDQMLVVSQYSRTPIGKL